LKTGLLILCIFVSTLTHAESKEEVLIYAYHLKPPFIIDADKGLGLYFDVAKLLTQSSKKYRYRLLYVPRKRIDLMIKDQLEVLLIGVNPNWFENAENYLWSNALMHDQDEFVSLKSHPFEYLGPDSLDGELYAGVFGYFYHGLNNKENAGKLARVNTLKEPDVLTLVEKNRANWGIISRSTFNYLKNEKQIADIFYLSAQSHDEFERFIMLPRGHHSILKEINQVLTTGNAKWQNLLETYHIMPSLKHN
jgi:polar amino acid transport system substrate-binding protein